MISVGGISPPVAMACLNWSIMSFMVCFLRVFWSQLGRCVFGLGGAGHAAIGVHPGINIGLKVKDTATFDELWTIPVAAHHGQSLVRKAGVLRGVACIHPAIWVSDYFDGFYFCAGHVDSFMCCKTIQ
jgi:hypothetical protein